MKQGMHNVKNDKNIFSDETPTKLQNGKKRPSANPDDTAFGTPKCMGGKDWNRIWSVIN